MIVLCIWAMKKYEKACYITFNETYQFIVNMLEDSPVDEDKFFIVDASRKVKKQENINRKTIVIPIDDLFNVYLFLRSLIKDEKINCILVDSISALIDKHSDLPLKEMLTDLLLEVGRAECDTSLVVSSRDINHDVVSHLRPLITKSMSL